MVKKFRVTGFVIAIIAVSIFCAGIKSFADTVYSPKVNRLLAEIKENNHAAAANTLNEMTTKEKDEFISYIRKEGNNVPPLYYIKMADYVLKTDKDEAAYWYYIGKIRAYEDVMTCKDKTSQAQLDVYPLFAPKTVKYISSRVKEKEYFANLMQKSLDWDISHPTRVSPIWACYQGMGAKTKTPELVSDEQKNKLIEQVRNEVRETIKKYQ